MPVYLDHAATTPMLPEAIAAYRRALQLDPNYAWAHFGLANALRDSDQLPEAAAEVSLQFPPLPPSSQESG